MSSQKTDATERVPPEDRHRQLRSRLLEVRREVGNDQRGRAIDCGGRRGTRRKLGDSCHVVPGR